MTSTDRSAFLLSPESVPPLPSAVNGLLMRPVWNERRSAAEREALRAASIRAGSGLPTGNNRPVVLVPGYMAGGSAFEEMAPWLSDGGYQVSFAPVGRNARSSSWAAEQIGSAVRRASEIASGAPVTLIGHSRGGQICRVVAARMPEQIDHLVTLGSPVRHHAPRYLPLRGAIALSRVIGRTPIGPPADIEADRKYEVELFTPFPIDRFASPSPWTAIYSRVDGVVEWQSCLASGARPIEVATSHGGLTASIASFEAIASALAQT